MNRDLGFEKIDLRRVKFSDLGEGLGDLFELGLSSLGVSGEGLVINVATFDLSRSTSEIAASESFAPPDGSDWWIQIGDSDSSVNEQDPAFFESLLSLLLLLKEAAAAGSCCCSSSSSEITKTTSSCWHLASGLPLDSMDQNGNTKKYTEN